MSKGIFWFPCFVGTEGELIFTEEIEVLPVTCDEDGNPPKGEADRPREYVRELEKRLRQGETKRLAGEKREMENVLKRRGEKA